MVGYRPEINHEITKAPQIRGQNRKALSEEILQFSVPLTRAKMICNESLGKYEFLYLDQFNYK